MRISAHQNAYTRGLGVCAIPLPVVERNNLASHQINVNKLVSYTLNYVCARLTMWELIPLGIVFPYATTGRKRRPEGAPRDRA
jgi:hypothetical protein